MLSTTTTAVRRYFEVVLKDKTDFLIFFLEQCGGTYGTHTHNDKKVPASPDERTPFEPGDGWLRRRVLALSTYYKAADLNSLTSRHSSGCA